MDRLESDTTPAGSGGRYWKRVYRVQGVQSSQRLQRDWAQEHCSRSPWRHDEWRIRVGPPRVCQESWYRKTIFSSLINWILEISEFLTPWFFFNKLCLLLQDIHLRPMSSLNYMKKALRLVIICFILMHIDEMNITWYFTVMLNKTMFHLLIFICSKIPQTFWQTTEEERWNWKAPWKRTAEIEGDAKRE